MTLTRKQVDELRRVNLEASRKADRRLLEVQYEVLEAQVHPYRDAMRFHSDRAVLHDLYQTVRNSQTIIETCDRVLEQMSWEGE